MSAHDDTKKGEQQDQLRDQRWTARDGSDFHEIMRGEAEQRYGFFECQHDVEAERYIQRVDENGSIVGFGFADLVVDDTYVIDYKTDQMEDWTEATARRKGDEYGRQIASYARSPQVGPDGEGHLFLVGSKSEHSVVNEAFVHAAAEHGVMVTFVESGDPREVMDQVESQFMAREQAIEPEVPLTEMVDASPVPTSNLDHFRRGHFDSLKALTNVEQGMSAEMGEIYAEVQQDFDSYAPDTDVPVGTDVSPIALAPIFLQWGINKVKESEFGQWVGDKIEAVRQERMISQIEVISPPAEVEAAIESMEAAAVGTQELQNLEAGFETITAEAPRLESAGSDVNAEFEAESRLEAAEIGTDLDYEPEPPIEPQLDPTPDVSPDLDPVADTTPDVDPTPDTPPDLDPVPDTTPDLDPTPDF